jgi:hypothetical protein
MMLARFLLPLPALASTSAAAIEAGLAGKDHAQAAAAGRHIDGSIRILRDELICRHVTLNQGVDLTRVPT